MATELADYLAAKGVPFREAHGIVNNLVEMAIADGRELRDLTLDDYKSASEQFGQDVLEITVETAIAKRNTIGGAAPSRVREAIAAARARLDSDES